MAKTLIGTKEVRSIMTKSNLPVGGYSVNPYVGCTHACKYCYPNHLFCIAHLPWHHQFQSYFS